MGGVCPKGARSTGSAATLSAPTKHHNPHGVRDVQPGRAVTKHRPIPKTLNQRSMIKLLTANGWTQTLGGKHNVKMEKAGERPITLPNHNGDDYGSSLRARILRQAGLGGGTHG